jgi:hypothetical protein
MRRYGAISSDKLATQFSTLLSRMAPRKPRLDWIKEVLADRGDRAPPPPLGFVWRPGTESADFQSMNDRPERPPERPEGDDRPFCPSWQLMRLTAARKS